MIPLRADLMQGDLRALSIWGGCSVYRLELNPNALIEPPCPAGLANLTTPLESLVDFLGLDADLINAAAEQSSDLSTPRSSRAKLAAWIKAMPEAEKNAFLLGMAESRDSCSRIELLRRFEQQGLPSSSHSERNDSHRTVSQIMAAAQSRAKERIRRETERKAAEQEKQGAREQPRG